MKFMKEFDTDGDGVLDFEEFKVAVKFAQERKKNQKHQNEVDVWSDMDI
jgi:Ca2+-binding EF-hand superfamily protein